MPLLPEAKNCDPSVKKNFRKISAKLGYTASPTYANITLTDLTASSLVGTNASKLLESVTIGTGLDYTRPTLSLSHLGIEDLTDPGADRIFFWDNSASASEWLAVGNSIAITTTTIDTIQDIRTSASPTFAGLTVTNSCVLGSNSAVFQPNADSTTFFQVLDADGGVPIINIDTVNERVGFGTATPSARIESVAASAVNISILSGGASDWCSLSMGRTAAEGFWGMAAAPSHFFDVCIAGDQVIRIDDNTKHLHLGIGTAPGVVPIMTIAAEGAGFNTATPSTEVEINGTLTFTSGGARTITTSGTSLILEQTGDTFGTTRLNIQSRGGSAGAIFESDGLDLVDFGFVGNTGYQSNFRYEHRAGAIYGGTDNTVGEFQFIDDPITTPTYFFTANKTATIIRFGVFGVNEDAPETPIELTHATPYLTLHNSTHEDSDGGRESRINFKGEQGVDPFEETTLARIEVGHDGSGADDKGYFDIFINDGNDGDSPTKSIRVDSLGTVFETGPIFLKETTTPTARTDYGAIYTQNNNELFFQDGDGVEHLLHGDAFSNIWFHGSTVGSMTVEVTISTEDTFAKIDSFTVVGNEDDIGNVVGSAAANTLTLSSVAGGEYEVSYHGSITATGGADKEMVFALGITLATPKDITNVTDDIVTPIRITSTAHGLENGDMVEIVGILGNTAANGSFIVDNKAANAFDIVTLDGTATTGNGDYNEGSPTGDITILYPGNMEIHRMVRGADFGAIAATDMHVLANSDVLALYVANLSGITNLTISSISLSVFRIGD